MLGNELLDFLPERLFDVHIHVFNTPPERLPEKDFRRKFRGRFSAADYFRFVESAIPGRQFAVNSFGMPEKGVDRDAADAFTGDSVDCARVFGLALTSPLDTPEKLETRMRRHRLCGFKPYPDLVPGKAVPEVELRDMLTEAQLELADRHGWIVLLHLPRKLRLPDPLNREQLTGWLRRYPRITFIVAHLGRSYFLKGIEGELERYAPYPNVFFDTAMINNDRVLEYAFRRFPRERLLFGTDAPISMLLGKALEINDQYLYLMGEDYAVGTSLDGRKAPIRFTTFFAEQLAGCRTAALAVRLSSSEKENFFYGNSSRLLREASRWLD